MRWTEERDTQLRKLRDQGFTFDDIAAKLDTTKGSVIGRAGRLGLLGRSQPVRRHVYHRAVASTPLLPSVGPVALLDLEPHQCRWPVNDAPYLFCAGTKIDGSSYCGRHFGVSRRGVT
jgi:hypothetical protein